jgi:hypothetical protein
MEVGIAKRLHHHSLPVIISLLLLFVISTGLLAAHRQDSVGRAWVTRVIDIKPTANGLGKITLHQAQKPSFLQDASQLGKTADLSLSFQ